jgi:hypothetical protein
MRRGHIYLDGKPYMLALDEDGRVAGANTAQLTGPWATQISQGPREYQDMTVRSVQVWDALTGGMGQYKGTDMTKYRRGTCDTRSGEVMLPPAVHGTASYLAANLPADDDEITQWEIGVHSDAEASSEAFNPTETGWVRTVGVLLRRSSQEDYSGAEPFQVRLDLAGTTGTVLVATVDMGDVETAWAWLPATAATCSQLQASTQYVVTLANASGPDVLWGAKEQYPSPPAAYYKMGGYGGMDGPVRSLVRFVGEDGQARMYAAVNRKVMSWDEDGEGWSTRSELAAPVRHLGVYGQRLWAALGASVAMWSFTGASLGGVWTEQTKGGQVTGVHDTLLWRGEGNEIAASEGTGTVVSWGATEQVGHNGETILDMVSQEGHLFARTEQGIYQVDYPTTYPGSDKPLVTRVVNLDADPSPHDKPVMATWNGGILFPTWYDLLQYQSGLITPIGLARGQAMSDEDRRNVWALHPTSRGVYAAMFQYPRVGSWLVNQPTPSASPASRSSFSIPESDRGW